MELNSIWQFISTRGADFSLKLVGAIAAWMIGRWLIGVAVNLFRKAMERSGKLDPTLTRYLGSIVSVILTIVLILAILDIVGVQTASFAALLAGAGLAIGTAWGGLLTHFAAGAFMQVLRPFKVGDFVSAGGVTGTVKELGLFGTTIISGDNVQNMVGNNKIFSDTIQNFSTLPYRRVDCVGKVANSVDPMVAITELRPIIAAIPNVLSTPAPELQILSFSAEGPVICVRPFANNDHYWQVYFDTNEAIAKTFSGATYPVPSASVIHRNLSV
jgi:small conductance mechanosensitive channel